jgi:hypothetical protein
MATTPQFATTPKCAMAQVSVANTGRDGTGTLATVYTAGASGSRIDRIVIAATGTTTAGLVRLFIHDGTNARLYTEIPVFANTVSSTTAAFNTTAEAVTMPSYMPILLPTGYSLRASTEKAETFNIIAVGGDN